MLRWGFDRPKKQAGETLAVLPELKILYGSTSERPADRAVFRHCTARTPGNMPIHLHDLVALAGRARPAESGAVDVTGLTARWCLRPVA
jgi:hypothetical protein